MLFLADMVVDMVADKEVDKVADMVAGHGCWLIGLKLFWPESYPACASSKLCKFIQTRIYNNCIQGPQPAWDRQAPQEQPVEWNSEAHYVEQPV